MTGTSNTGHKILIVDDHEPMRILLKRMLEKAGFQVTVAVSGEMALNLLVTNTFDLMLLDIMMPAMDGYQVLETTRKKFHPQELPIIMVTTVADQEAMDRTRALGACGYMVKPIDFGVLIQMIREQLSESTAQDRA